MANGGTWTAFLLGLALAAAALAAPAEDDAARQAALDVCQSRYAQARGPDKIQAGEELAALLVRFADEDLAAKRFDDAARLYQRALPLAVNLRGVNHDEIKAKLDYAATRQGFLSQAMRLKEHLKEQPDDQESRERLMRIYIVEFDNPQAAARQLDLAKDDPAQKYILLAGMSIEKLPARACAALGHWYRDLAREASPHGRYVAMLRARTYYERYLAAAEPDPDLRANVEKGLAEVNDVLADAVVALPAITIVTYETFAERWAAGFPPTANVAGTGTARASSHWGDRLPQRVFGGLRTDTAWSLDNPRGWFEATWDPPAHGRYILLFGRSGETDADPWGQATLTLNGSKPHRIDGMTSGRVVIVDLGLVVPVRSLRLSIAGTMYPGLAGIDIHPIKAEPPAEPSADTPAETPAEEP
ncbi:MAG: hypothetical protein ISS74_00470 [Planctomycetes bacterium]|nr:hypothetical protein [Planctomycetota bacterium]